jgi:CrcB protein
MIRAVLIVGLGGAIGSMLRYLTSVFVAKYYANAFPLATFIVNIIGCFIIGLLAGFLAKSQFASQEIKWFLITGLCGGYTTFSAFSYENIQLIETNNFPIAFANIVGSVFVGLIAVWLGLMLTK